MISSFAIRSTINNPLFLDPSAWTKADVGKWLRHTMRENSVPVDANAVNAVKEWESNLAGADFANLEEAEFRQKLVQVLVFFIFLNIFIGSIRYD